MESMTCSPTLLSSNCQLLKVVGGIQLTFRYQFNPQMSNPEVIINILLKSLVATVHGPDFNLCLSLLRDPAVS